MGKSWLLCNTTEKFNLAHGFTTFELAQQTLARTILIYNHKYPHKP